MAVQGLNALLRKFEMIPEKVIEAARETLEQNATEIVAMMKRLVPVESGALRDSIGWTWGDAPKGSLTIGIVKGGRKAGTRYASMVITIYVGTHDKKLGKGDAYYARFQEFGTKNMAANPFFYPSYRALKATAKGRMTRAVRKAVAQA